MKTSKRKKLIGNFARFIEEQGPWDMFITLTFRKKKDSFLLKENSFLYEEKEVVIAKRCLKMLFKYLNTDKMSFFDKYVICLTVFEKEHVRDSVHIHLFLRGIDPTKANDLKKRCLNFYLRRKKYLGESNRKPTCERLFEQVAIYPYDSEKRARFYLANKYGSSDMVHWDIYRINSRRRKIRRKQ